MQAQKKKQLIFLIITTFVVCLFYKYLLPFILPFLFAYWFALFLYPIITKLRMKLGLPQALSTFLIITAFFVLTGLGLFYLFRILIIQLDGFLKNIPFYQELIYAKLEDICCLCDDYFRLNEGSSYEFISTNFIKMQDSIQTKMIPQMTEQAVFILKKAASFSSCLFIVIISTLLILNDKVSLEESYKNSPFYEDIHPVAHKLCSFFGSYFRMQAIVTSIIAIVCSICFFLVKSDYALLFGIFVSIFDAFPILGSGLILIPIAIYHFISGNFLYAAIFFTTYAFCQIIRQTMEPRLLGNRIGIPPIFTIMFIFIGIKFYGIIGVFLGPITYVTIRTILETYQINSSKT